MRCSCICKQLPSSSHRHRRQPPRRIAAEVGYSPPYRADSSAHGPLGAQIMLSLADVIIKASAQSEQATVHQAHVWAQKSLDVVTKARGAGPDAPPSATPVQDADGAPHVCEAALVAALFNLGAIAEVRARMSTHLRALTRSSRSRRSRRRRRSSTHGAPRRQQERGCPRTQRRRRPPRGMSSAHSASRVPALRPPRTAVHD
jgi:hypothetical protein